jgi:hypothetical protein
MEGARRRIREQLEYANSNENFVQGSSGKGLLYRYWTSYLVCHSGVCLFDNDEVATTRMTDLFVNSSKISSKISRNQKACRAPHFSYAPKY